MIDKKMELWDSVKETNPKWTKPGQNMLTSINGQYCMMRATEKFGPCGIGWGYRIVEERYDEGPEINHETVPYKPITHTLRIRLWYNWNGEKGEVEHFGHTPFIMKSKRGPYQDDEAPKKSLTDAIKKCLSMIGIGADIHLGQFEDINYKNELELKAAEESDKEREEKENIIRSGLSSYMLEAGNNYTGASTIPALNMVHKSSMNHIRRECQKINRNSDATINVLTEMYKNKKETMK